MKIRYLFDENLDPRFVRTMQRHYPEIDVLRVGDSDAPAFGMSDPDILVVLEEHDRILVTDNRKSMPGHVQAHRQDDITGEFSWLTKALRTNDSPMHFLSIGMLHNWKTGLTKWNGSLSRTRQWTVPQ